MAGQGRTTQSNVRGLFHKGSFLQWLRKNMGLGDTLGALPEENGGTGTTNGSAPKARLLWEGEAQSDPLTIAGISEYHLFAVTFGSMGNLVGCAVVRPYVFSKDGKIEETIGTWWYGSAEVQVRWAFSGDTIKPVQTNFVNGGSMYIRAIYGLC